MYQKYFERLVNLVLHFIINQDSNRTVSILLYKNETDDWIVMGKIRSHYKPLTDMIFSSYLPPELFSIGLDRHLVKYDLANR